MTSRVKGLEERVSLMESAHHLCQVDQPHPQCIAIAQPTSNSGGTNVVEENIKYLEGLSVTQVNACMHA